MSRSARLVLDNVCYHVITRGNQRQQVFFKEEDFEKYLGILTKYKKKYHFAVYGYCLMPNHAHLLIGLDDKADLAKVMQGINQSYTRYFNFRYKKSGHLWQGRFKSMVIYKDEYLLNCVKYIELNPIRAKIIDNPLDYQWSSYKTRTIGTQSALLDTPKL
ncbi:MAG: transposase [Candidatus Omnitrophica bacterium]|nr:transposase [Candidatus Omnitrophota bacterium]